MSGIFDKRFATITSMILVAAISRFLPHPPNFTPVMAMAIFAGATFSNKIYAFLVPLCAMLLSDVFLGLHSMMVAVYLCFGIAVLLGAYLRNRKTPVNIVLITLAGSVIFFIITNFAMWLLSGLYPLTIDGLTMCYAAALPFYKYNTFFISSLLGDLTYSVVLFGAFALAERFVPTLKKARVWTAD